MILDVHPENAMQLLAATAKTAISDAKRGDDEAHEWLCEVLPEWTKYANPSRRYTARRKVAAAGVALSPPTKQTTVALLSTSRLVTLQRVTRLASR
jgi:hypothetical protein